MKIEIRDFKGIFTNADQEDIQNEYMTALVNFRPVNGRLVKTFENATSEKITVGDPASMPANIKSMFTFVNENLSAGHIYIGVQVVTNTNIAIYGYDPTGENLELVTTLTADDYDVDIVSLYQDPDNVHAIFNSGIMRVMPGRI